MAKSDPPLFPAAKERREAWHTVLFLRAKHAIGLDRAIAFTVLARGWSTIAGVVTMLLITRFLTPAEQGYYYTFASLVALQIVFELGFSFVILQLAAHEQAALHFHEDGSITGDSIAHARLASVLQKAVRWYALGAVLMAAGLLPIGFYFFGIHRQPGPQVSWLAPWVAVVLASVFTFQMDPVFSFLEGCGRISEVARMRFTQAAVGSLMAWSALCLHHGLLAPALVICGQALAGGLFLFKQRRLLLPLLQRDTSAYKISWGHEIWPFQWRIAISWLCGYFIFQIFNPVLFAARGASEAGRMGMSLNIASALSGIAVAWMNTKASPIGTLIARREYTTLDRLFFRTLIQSTLVLAAGASVTLLGLYFVAQRFPHLAARVLPLPAFGVLMATIIFNHVVLSEAIYLRAHKREPLLPVSITAGILTACSTIALAKSWGASGVTVGYFCTNGIVGLALATYVFINKRAEWHGPSSQGPGVL